MGPFISDIVVMEANKLNETKKEAIEKMKGEEVEGIWGSIRGNKKEVGDYKEEGLGALVGYTREVNEGVRIMPILNVSKEDMRESTKKERGVGERETLGLGLATGVEINEMSIKAILMGERGEVKTSRIERNTEGKDCKATGELKTIGATFGVGADYRIRMNKKIDVIPTVGFTAVSIKRDKYEEKGEENAVRMGTMNLARNIVNTGVNVEVKDKKYKLRAGLGVDVIVNGERGKARGYGNTSFYGEKDPAGLDYAEGNKVKVESESTEQGKVIGTGNIGIEYDVSRRVKVGIEVSMEKGKNSESVSGKVNGKYDLGRKRHYGRRLRVAKNNVIKALRERKEYAREELEKKKEELERGKRK
jgi:outer membrane autotransporter protein